MCKRYLLALVLVLEMLPLVYAQTHTIVFDFVDEMHQLPANSITDFYEDSKGHLWMAGLRGLLKYDGFNFTHSFNPADSNQLILGNALMSIAEDSKGRLWIGTLNTHLQISNVEKTTLQTISDKDLAGLSSSITDIVIDKSDRVFLAGSNGLQVIAEEATGFILKTYDIDAVPQVLYIDNNDRLWIGTDRGLYRLHISTDRLETPMTNPGFPKEEIEDIQVDRTGRIWLSRESSQSRMLIYDTASDGFQHFNEINFESNTRRIHFTFDADNRIWISVFGEQLYGYNLNTKTTFLKSGINSNIPKERFIRRPFCDAYGNIWIGGGNLFKYDFQRGFNNYQHPLSFYQTATCILVEEANTWIAYRENGFIRINQKQEIIHYQTSAKAPFKTPTDLIQRFIRLSNGNLVAVGYQALIFINQRHEIFKTIPLRGSTKSVMEDKQQNLWVAGFDGLLQYSLDGRLQKTYKLPLLGTDNRQFIFALEEDSEGNIWFGSNGLGLGKLDILADRITHFRPVEHADSLHTAYIYDLLFDQAGNLWLATNTGVVKFDLLKQTFKTLGEKHSLQHDFICALLEDNNGVIWASTVNGLSSINTKDYSIINYNRADGLLNHVYYQGSRDKYGEMLYFGGRNGIDYFNPKSIRKTSKDPSLQITRFFIDNVDAQKRIEDNHIELSYAEDLIDIEFGATRFATNDIVKYAYKVDGLVDDWVALNEQRKIVFSDLAPGDYRLEVRASINNDNWLPNTLILNLAVSTPFWRTTWFLIGLCLLSAFCIWSLVKWREKMAARKEKEAAAIKQRILALEKKALLAQMNPHFIFNSMNAVQQFIAVEDNENAMRYLSKFSRLMRQVLNGSSRDEVTIFEEIRLVESYLELEKMRYPNRLEYTIRIDDDLNIQGLKIQPLLIQPYVEQATQNSLLNYNGDSHVLVQFSRKDKEYLYVQIEDRSDQDSEYSPANDAISESASIVQERLKHVSKKIHQENIQRHFFTDPIKQQKGSRVELFIDLIYTN